MHTFLIYMSVQSRYWTRQHEGTLLPSCMLTFLVIFPNATSVKKEIQVPLTRILHIQIFLLQMFFLFKSAMVSIPMSYGSSSLLSTKCINEWITQRLCQSISTFHLQNLRAEFCEMWYAGRASKIKVAI